MTARIARRAGAAAGLVVLAACQNTLSPCDIPRPAGQVAAASWMTDCTASLEPTSFAALPGGSASYSGYVTGQFAPAAGSTDTLVGDAVLTVAFGAASNAVSGTLGNFTASSGGALGGTLSVSSGPLIDNAGKAVFFASISGTLTGYGGSDTVTFATGGGGGLLGDAAQGITLVSSGTATMGSGYVDNNAGLAVVGLR